jgi:UDP-2,3-diacylglucosamine hydrolase
VIPVDGLPEFPIVPGTKVIADLHLDLGHPEGAKPFLDWLARNPRLPGLVVLGDFFDVWVGPAQEETPGAPPLLDALRAVVARGARVDVVHGNRDFLLDASFERRTGAKVHPMGFVGRYDRAAAGDPVGRAVLIHGDELCTRDKAYIRLRKVLRSGPVRGIAPRLPLSVATFVARSLRRTSARAVDRKPPDTKIVQEAACRWHATAYHADTVVCGHAHRYRDMRLSSGPRWIVLDAFGGDRDVLEFGADGEIRVSRSA